MSIGIYNPALAYNIPPIMNVLENINNLLHVDEIASYIGVDKIIPDVYKRQELEFITGFNNIEDAKEVLFNGSVKMVIFTKGKDCLLYTSRCV